MFSRRSNASKVALVALVHHLREQNFVLLDCQQTTAHLVSMGAREIPREQFLQQLRKAQVPPYGDLVSRF